MQVVSPEVHLSAPPRVLVVDDETILQQAIKKALKHAGYELLFADDGKMGLEFFHRESPELIFLDLRMPVLDGIGFLRSIDYKPADPYTVVVITGHGGDEDIQKCYNLGVHSFLRKPINLVEISSLAERCIRFKRLEQEREKLVRDLQQAQKTIQTLEDFLPICASCKKIRDEGGHWHEIESYIRSRANIEFSHSICPVCAIRLYPSLYDADQDKKK